MDLLTDYTLISGSDNAINAIPASMYASQIWATPFLRQGREMDNPQSSRSQRHHSLMVRRARV
jgi:hypothetical protein